MTLRYNFGSNLRKCRGLGGQNLGRVRHDSAGRIADCPFLVIRSEYVRNDVLSVK